MHLTHRSPARKGTKIQFSLDSLTIQGPKKVRETQWKLTEFFKSDCLTRIWPLVFFINRTHLGHLPTSKKNSLFVKISPTYANFSKSSLAGEWKTALCMITGISRKSIPLQFHISLTDVYTVSYIQNPKQGWASVLFKRTFRSLRSFLFFIKERNDLCILFCSL